MKLTLATLFVFFITTVTTSANATTTHITDNSSSSAGAISSENPSDEICILSIVPCPKKCSDTCVYPNLPCPKQYKPHCPPRHKRKNKRGDHDFITMVFTDDVKDGSICPGNSCTTIFEDCPKECPSSCEFKNPVDPCCPFSGEPFCSSF